MKQNWKLLLMVLTLSATIMLSSCGDDDEAIPEKPNMSFSQGSENIDLQPGRDVTVVLSLSASEGLKSLDVDLNDADFDDESYTETLTATYNLDYAVPFTADFGSTLIFDFVVTDNRDQMDSLTVTVNVVENTYTITEEVIGSTTVLAIKGDISDQLVLDANSKYLLDSAVEVTDGGEIVIPAGTMIYARSYRDEDGINPGDNNSRLDILPGGLITAEGTASNPVVFTSSFELDPTRDASPGDWGGVGLYGRAPTNANPDGTNSFDGTPIVWGGSDESDNSGVLKYVRIEYSGIGNALNLFGVGTGTTLEYIQIWKSADEGFKMNGGRANMKYIACTDLYTDDLEAEDGWIGNVQFYLIEQNRDRNGQTAMAIKNGSGGTPPSRPTFSNVTYIGPGLEFKDDPFDYDNEGIDVQNTGQGRFFNILFTENPDDAVRVRNATQAIIDPVSEDTIGIGGDLVVAHCILWNNNDNWQDDGDIFNTPQFNNSTEDPGIGVGLDSFVGVVTTGALDPSTLDPWFTSVNFIGAVPADNDWTSGGWFRERDGSIKQ
ncbi:MAG: hypothetical protein KI790_05495 [Cyclobacteriaceae bacterium]|nr:hypothetical protein [Cyclobacteriaceae bacterium HetDA_MAG_MS6]